MFEKGIIEAFYGKAWTFQQRHNMLDFLSDIQFTHYIYAPKSDDYLRKYCHIPYPEADLLKLKAFREKAYDSGIRWGVGLSPIGLLNEQSVDSGKLDEKLEQLVTLKPDCLAVLFDDMRGDITDLAGKQAELVEYISRALPSAEILMCPTYYSDDAVLEEIFGNMPENYWQNLGMLLPLSVKVFWTGPKVVTEKYSQTDFDDINKLFGRKITLWDNSMVNDGKLTCNFLPVKSMDYLESIYLNVGGVFVNPMNVFSLAQLNLQTLALSGDAEQRLSHSIESHCPEASAMIFKVLPELRETGLDNMGEKRKQELKKEFSVFNDACSREIVDWLENEYQFDPACLT